MRPSIHPTASTYHGTGCVNNETYPWNITNQCQFGCCKLLAKVLQGARGGQEVCDLKPQFPISWAEERRWHRLLLGQKHNFKLGTKTANNKKKKYEKGSCFYTHWHAFPSLLSVCLIFSNSLTFCDLSVYISPTCCNVCLCACQSHTLPLFLSHFIYPLPFLKRQIQC